ncbi:3-phosphoshikimate 1-carboxyvinyltransferase [Shouchella clausii]|uniref:3-phosphoshikimate 1-carboxyvinyltransferase n=1 Tax=Shouchella clausii TaxID=79880 RepID=A0A268RZD3_SHOCL|nr:3-phosphoshikimate 1-carboxyvinyltransferase [Shouchella clausii]MBU8597710.1 3-phosphoshikimate 1-carboxyvinyltransferase [Shouchella clausii]MCY1104260.1 3-phosphoshikimate 1-carboxyvinyltransferase [Shouchella clausii]MEB5479587.1 3-phosphoshikimate 1-carboxyvinyltransferase [Shouchella clausii]MED4159496.1 3-phosphoshikimate 1-carboxyvinyltransferase [Shouchella clausii]MED4176215.1 3-phosphoshikimate 1-carboxyvinyltransferase [Shouchella clausii]
MDETIKVLNKAESGLSGTIVVPGDKSISHRAVMFGAMANGTTNVSGFLPGDDCLSTIACFRQMGVAIEQEGDKVTVEGKGLDGLKEPNGVLDVGNSGTTIRLLLGVLSGRPFHSVVVGDDSIGKRPMARVTAPLRQMGAQIDGRETGNKTPLSIRGGQTKAIEYTMPVASAQVKSALLLAGLQAKGETSVTEPQTTRDHTERMLHAFGVKVTTAGKTISIQGGQSLQAADVVVPGDISSAAFFLVAGCIVPGSRVHLKNVGLNPTRAGILEVLKRSGAKLSIDEQVTTGGEPRGDMTISTSELSPFVIEGEEVPTLIDEIPVLAVLATQISGTTIIRDAEELKVKETNRIDTVVGELAKLGADIEATDDGMIIRGGKPLTGGKVDSHGDHRIGMALVIASLCANGPVELANTGAISVSYPQFFEHLQSLQ